MPPPFRPHKGLPLYTEQGRPAIDIEFLIYAVQQPEISLGKNSYSVIFQVYANSIVCMPDLTQALS